MVAPEPSDSNQDLNDDADSAAESRRRGLNALLALIILLLLACCCVAMSQMAIVPDVVGLDVDEARRIVIDAGFTAGVSGVEVADDADVGVVTAQSPTAGTRAFKRTEVMLTVESGSSDAGTIPRSSGVDDPGFSDDSSGEPAGTGVPSGAAGTVDTRPLTPNVQNMTEAAALTTLRNAGYQPVIGGYGPTTAGVREGHVYYQDPAPDARLSRGGIVTLWISSGAPHDDGYEGVPYPGPGR